MALVYKNFLIFNRNETSDPYISSVLKKLNVNFNDANNIWHVKSDTDKLILIYDSELSNTNSIKKIYNLRDDLTCIGYIKIYCQNTDIKIFDYNFKSAQEAKKHLIVFKKYLHESIKNSGSTTKFTLHWKKNIYNKDLEYILKKIELVSDLEKRIYTFSNYAADPVVNKNSLYSFGSMGSWSR